MGVGIETPPPTKRGVVNTGLPVLPSAFVSGALVDWVEFTLFDRLPKRACYHGGQFGEDGLPVLLTMAERSAVDNGEVCAREYLPQPWTPKEAFQLLGLEAWAAEVKTLADGTKHSQVVNVPEKMPRGMNGYKLNHVLSGARVLSAGNEDMGVHVIISGGALKNLPVDAVTTVRRCLQAGAKFTRLDVAVDDFDGALDLEQMVDYCRQGRCSSRSKEWAVTEGGAIKDGASTGRTLYVGNRTSDVYFRFYDKRAEQIKEGAIPERLPAHWIRAEAELKGVAAIKAGREIAEAASLPVMAKALLNNYIGFKDQTKKGQPTTDTNKGRWDKASWWLAWLESVEKLSVSRRIKPTEFSKRIEWFTRQAAPTLALMTGELEQADLMAIYRAGRAALTDKHHEEVKRHKVAAICARAAKENFKNETNVLVKNRQKDRALLATDLKTAV